TMFAAMGLKNAIRSVRAAIARRGPPVVGVVRLSGVIGNVMGARTGLTLAEVAGHLEHAFELPNVKCVALAVSSPGGSPVQSALIARRIRSLATEKNIPVVAFVEDAAASGGYWLACAADEIFADESSIVGSIGVVSAGFGFQGLIDRLGVERRLHTAGEKKAMLDPFQPEDPEEGAHLEVLLADIHESFKAMVRERRGKRLRADEAELFTGQFWTGRRALELGLVDGLGDLRATMRSRYGDKVQLRLIGGKEPLWKRLLSRPPGRTGVDAEAVAASLAGAALAWIEERAHWARFGL